MGQGDPRLAAACKRAKTLSGGLTSRLKACEAICCRKFQDTDCFCAVLWLADAGEACLQYPLLPSSCPANGQLHVVPLTANVYTSSSARGMA